MKMSDKLEFRCQGSLAVTIDAIANRTGLTEYEVVQRLIRLGLQDVEEIDDEVLFGAASSPRTGDHSD